MAGTPAASARGAAGTIGRGPEMSSHRPGTGELTIGIVGPHDVVERVMLSGAGSGIYATSAPQGSAGGAAGQGGGPLGSQVTAGPGAPVTGASWTGFGLAARLVAAAYRDEHEAAEKASRLGSSVDVCLFASPVPYEYARRAGAIAGPATFVPLNGAALRTALLRASLDGRFDLARISMDVLARSDIDEMYAELGMSAEHVHAREEVASAATLAAFHERLWRRGETTVALTCVHAVAQRLAAVGRARPSRYGRRAARSGPRCIRRLCSARITGWKRRPSPWSWWMFRR